MNLKSRKKEFFPPKASICKCVSNVNIDKIVVSEEFSSPKKGCKYLSATKVMRKFHCCVPCATIVSRYVKDFDGAKTTLFLAKAEQLLKK